MSGLYQRIRPRTFSGVVGQDAAIRLIKAQPKTGVFFPVNLFIGEHGCGKTTVAEIMAMAANCLSLTEDGSPCLHCVNCKAVLSGTCGDIQEIDAASNNGVDFVRLFTEQAGYLPMMLKRRVFILDEVHMLSNAAFNALLKLFENVPEHTMFILCTTDPQKIPKTVRSRCHSYTFGCIATETIRDYLLTVSRENGYDIEPEALTVIARNACGAMRDALVLLEQVAVTGGHLTKCEVSELLGTSDDRALSELLHAILSGDERAVIEMSGQYADEGKNFETLIKELLMFLRDVKTAFWGGKVFGTEEYTALLSGYRKYPIRAINDLTAILYEARKALREDPVQSNFDVQMTIAMRTIGNTGIKNEEGIPEEKKEDSSYQYGPGNSAKSSMKPIREPAFPEDAPKVPEENFSAKEQREETGQEVPETIEERMSLPCLDDDGNLDFWSFSDGGEETGESSGFIPSGPDTPFDGEKGVSDGKCPVFLKNLPRASEKALRCAEKLREICGEEPAFLCALSGSVTGYPEEEGFLLIASDNAAFGCVSVYLRKYHVENVILKKTVG